MNDTKIMNLAADLGDNEMVMKGATIFKAIIGIYVFAILGTVTYAIMYPFPFLRVLAGVFSCISIILTIVSYILFLAYLARAKKMATEALRHVEGDNGIRAKVYYGMLSAKTAEEYKQAVAASEIRPIYKKRLLEFVK